MFGVVDIIVNLYRETPLSIRFCYAIWVLFIGLYLYSSLYEKHNKLKIQRKLKRRNWPFTLYILGAISLAVYYLSGNEESSLIPLVSWKLNALSINIGFVVMVLGLLIVTFARAAIDGFWGPNIYEYSEGQRQLITSGIYAYVRHPVYIGQILLTTGSVFMANQFILLYFPIITAIVNKVRATREEEELLEMFNNEYKAYKDKVSFMIPF